MLLNNNVLTFLDLLLFVVIAPSFKMSVRFTENSGKYINGIVIKPNIHAYHQTTTVQYYLLFFFVGVLNYLSTRNIKRISMTHLCFVDIC